MQSSMLRSLPSLVEFFFAAAVGVGNLGRRTILELGYVEVGDGGGECAPVFTGGRSGRTHLVLTVDETVGAVEETVGAVEDTVQR
jgi:hypothetical protein